MFLLDPQGEELVASVFDGAVQAQVGRSLYYFVLWCKAAPLTISSWCRNGIIMQSTNLFC